MNLAKLLALLKQKPKPRPIYVGDTLVGYDDGLPNSVKIDKERLRAALTITGRIDHVVPFSYLNEMGKLVYRRGSATVKPLEAILAIDTYADKAIYTGYNFPYGVSTGGAYLEAREQDVATNDRNYYYVRQEPAASTADRKIVKRVAGSETVIATEAADYGDWFLAGVRFQCVGTTIKCFQTEAADSWWHAPIMDILYTYAVEKLSVTDTSLANGRYGISNWCNTYHPGHGTTAFSYMTPFWVLFDVTFICDPASPSALEPIAYFEVPIVGSGKMPSEPMLPVTLWSDENIKAMVDPFRVEMPEEIVEIKKPVPKALQQKVEVLRRKGWSEEEIMTFLPEAYPVEHINRLALSWSALIPTDSKGKPTSNTAIVRVFPSSPEYVHPIEKRIQALKEMRGVRQLSREDAIDLALKMDDKLHIHDLIPCTKHDLGGKCYQEYRDWRIATVGDKPEHADTDIRKRYVKEGKGW
ncbi:MAG: hypothetical protein QW175_05375 [Candidatus Bathyarchaeia archaeon]